jgi:uncharacterized protein YndB with AHSA1/START domain
MLYSLKQPNVMETTNKTSITVECTVKAPVEKVWRFWTEPGHITKWAYAVDTWHTPRAENDLHVGGKFSSRMEAKDGSVGFDFGGVYNAIVPDKYIEYTMDDGRKVKITFTENNEETKITESFEAEETNPVEMQRGGWQAILDNFKRYTEENAE